jgi:hypothetical protein
MMDTFFGILYCAFTRFFFGVLFPFQVDDFPMIVGHGFIEREGMIK